MNRITGLRISLALGAAGILFCAAAWGEGSEPARPSRFAKAWSPCEGTLGLQAGAQASRFRSSPEYRSLVEPVPAVDGPWASPSWGAAFTLRWRPGFTLSLSPRRETYGLRTVEDTVAFAGNPYPHTLEARTELTYDIWPILAGIGWYPGKRHFQVQLGAYQSFLDQARIVWKVDGMPYAGRPPVSIRESVGGWMLALEYGWRLGPGDLVFRLETLQAWESALSGLKGSLRPESAQVRAGYAWVLWD